MDRVRLGRALGYGTRHAAKTLLAVAEAASAQDPQTTAGPAEVREAGFSGPKEVRASRPVRRLPNPAQLRGAGRSVWAPLATFSGALWLRVTGLFFGLIAFAMGGGAWRLRGVVRAGGQAAGRFWVFAGFMLLFGYFALSSFVRARLRESQGARSR